MSCLRSLAAFRAAGFSLTHENESRGVLRGDVCLWAACELFTRCPGEVLRNYKIEMKTWEIFIKIAASRDRLFTCGIGAVLRKYGIVFQNLMGRRGSKLSKICGVP